MCNKLSFHRFFLRGILFLTSAILVSALATADATETSNHDSLTVKQHLIKWMLTDQKFIDKAVLGSRSEIELSQLALEKAQALRVRDFAKAMVHDHTAADTELGVIAQSKNLPVPAALDGEHQYDVNRLKNLSDAQFDAAYIDLMRQDHDSAVSLFAAAANDDKLAPELREFA